jgi:hypothetical protein
MEDIHGPVWTILPLFVEMLMLKSRDRPPEWHRGDRDAPCKQLRGGNATVRVKCCGALRLVIQGIEGLHANSLGPPFHPSGAAMQEVEGSDAMNSRMALKWLRARPSSGCCSLTTARVTSQSNKNLYSRRILIIRLG